jgi:K+-sensing histidine kinase KdpD
LKARLIDDLLDLTRIAHGKLRLNQSELEVHDILNDAISTVLDEIEKNKFFLNSTFEPTAIKFSATPFDFNKFLGTF